MLSLKQRTFRTQGYSCCPRICSTFERLPTYKEWDEGRMLKAYEVTRRTLSIRRAALQYNVPKSTLSDKVSGRVSFNSHSCPTHYLTDDEEELVSFLAGSARMGYAKTKKEDVAIVEEVIAF